MLAVPVDRVSLVMAVPPTLVPRRLAIPIITRLVVVRPVGSPVVRRLSIRMPARMGAVTGPTDAAARCGQLTWVTVRGRQMRRGGRRRGRRGRSRRGRARGRRRR
ncbi:hypothetical protein A5680_18410 [Mycobacterium sp. E2989]|nr:hypothetical protein A5680_18410 [Mycobacterium sp. E2989]